MMKRLFLILTFVLSSCSLINRAVPTSKYAIGEITEIKDKYGTFFIYVPEELSKQTNVLVLIHGTPSESEAETETAYYYIYNWKDFAKRQGFILIVPTFNQKDFSSRHGEIIDSLTGFRGLFGREIGADEWVLRLVAAFQQEFELENEKFYLYGHSAGGQYVGRFLVTHPEKVKKGVITAAVTYPQPKVEISWPYGMGELHSEIHWEDGTSEQVDIIPEKQKWIEATQVPVTVIVGMGDTEPQLERPGQEGTNRILIGQNWVDDMATFARENGIVSQIKFGAIPAKGHGMLGLIPYSQAALIGE
jgi:poly(3-hydroxybutyrate) depolymerase